MDICKLVCKWQVLKCLTHAIKQLLRNLKPRNGEAIKYQTEQWLTNVHVCFCLYVSATLWNVVSVFLHCAAAAGAGGPGAQRFPPSVRLREAEGAADPDGGPRLRRPDGDGGHGACHAAPGVPPGLLNHISSDIFIQCYAPTPIFEHVLKRSAQSVDSVMNPFYILPIFCLIYISGLALSTVISFHPVSVSCVSIVCFFNHSRTCV